MLNKDEIIRMAREACSPHQVLNTDLVFLERFAALVAAHEREACAKVCDEWNWSSKHGAHPSSQLAAVAAAIRAREEKDCSGAQHHRYAGSFGG